jgi:hypothetical protein
MAITLNLAAGSTELRFATAAGSVAPIQLTRAAAVAQAKIYCVITYSDQ